MSLDPSAAPEADVVVQGLHASVGAARAIAHELGADDMEAFGSGPTVAFRLRSPRSTADLQALAERHHVDCAIVPRNRRLSDVRVVAMDMDSTLITIECIDEIADMLGIRAEVSAITASAMRGEIDFRESLTRRVALLKGLPVEALQRVYDERLRLSPGTEAMLARFHAAGAQSLLVSGGFTFFTDRLKQRVGLHHAVSNELDVHEGRLTGRIAGEIVDAEAKARALRKLRALLPPGLAVAIGDGANDLPLFAQADVSVAYRAKPVVRAQATHALDYSGLDGVANLFA